MTRRWRRGRRSGRAVVIAIALSGAALATRAATTSRPAPPSRVSCGPRIKDFASSMVQLFGLSGSDGTGPPRSGSRGRGIRIWTTGLRRVTSNGIPGTSMPPFSRQAGGTLTEEQIDVLVRIRGRWSRPDALGGVTPPAYRADVAGEPVRGEEMFRTFCASCHGPDGKADRGSAIVDGSCSRW